MIYTIIGLAITVILGGIGFYIQNKTLTILLKMQYDTLLAIHHIDQYHKAYYRIANPIDKVREMALTIERLGIVGRRVNKLMRDHKIDIPELIDDNGR